MGNKRHSKQIDGRSRRALTSQPGKRARNNRLTSSSPKFRGHSDKGNLEDNPYTWGIGITHNIEKEDKDDNNMINIETQIELNKTEGGIVSNLINTYSHS